MKLKFWAEFLSKIKLDFDQQENISCQFVIQTVIRLQQQSATGSVPFKLFILSFPHQKQSFASLLLPDGMFNRALLTSESLTPWVWLHLYFSCKIPYTLVSLRHHLNDIEWCICHSYLIHVLVLILCDAFCITHFHALVMKYNLIHILCTYILYNPNNYTFNTLPIPITNITHYQYITHIIA